MSVEDWVRNYVAAWRSNDPEDIAALFSPDAEYHETPYETHWIGRDAIVAGWRGRWDWQQGGWNFEWSVTSRTPARGRTKSALATGTGHYTELGNFSNEWTLEFEPDGRCRRFGMVNEQLD